MWLWKYRFDHHKEIKHPAVCGGGGGGWAYQKQRGRGGSGRRDGGRRELGESAMKQRRSD